MFNVNNFFSSFVNYIESKESIKMSTNPMSSQPIISLNFQPNIHINLNPAVNPADTGTDVGQGFSTKTFTIGEETNLLPYFMADGLGAHLAHQLLNPAASIDDHLKRDAVNFAMDILYKENNKQLKFGQQKMAILHTVAQSLVETFPRLKTPIRLMQNPELEHV